MKPPGMAQITLLVGHATLLADSNELSGIVKMPVALCRSHTSPSALGQNVQLSGSAFRGSQRRQPIAQYHVQRVAQGR